MVSRYESRTSERTKDVASRSIIISSYLPNFLSSPVLYHRSSERQNLCLTKPKYATLDEAVCIPLGTALDVLVALWKHLGHISDTALVPRRATTRMSDPGAAWQRRLRRQFRIRPNIRPRDLDIYQTVKFQSSQQIDGGTAKCRLFLGKGQPCGSSRENEPKPPLSLRRLQSPISRGLHNVTVSFQHFARTHVRLK